VNQNLGGCGIFAEVFWYGGDGLVLSQAARGFIPFKGQDIDGILIGEVCMAAVGMKCKMCRT
jgi:hypothetical protein